jgi:DNA-directed RNA polymerase subunit K/omega
MSKRVELLNRVDGSEMSPFLLCNLLARRARQLADGRHAVVSPELVNEVLREFLEGMLKYEVEGAGHIPCRVR